MKNGDIRLSEDGLCMIYRVRDGMITRLFIKDDKSVCFYGENEFWLALETDGRTALIRSRECAAGIKKASDGSFKINFEHDLFSAEVSYKIKDGVFYKTLSVRAKTPFLIKQAATETFETASVLSRGGEGQPVFADGEMFVGTEFPSACNGFADSQLDIRQNPYVTLEKDGVFRSFDVVFGFRRGGTIEESFEEHIRSRALKKDRPLKIYCDWGLHDELSDNIRLSDKMVKDMISQIDRLRRGGSFSFDFYLMDAFWWEDGGRYLEFKKSAWPNGVSEIKEKLAGAGLEFGLWFDANMGLVGLSADESSPRGGGGGFCIADKRTVGLLKTALLHHIRNTGIKMIKFDFAYFDCTDPAHKFHACGGAGSKEPAVRNFIEMISGLKAAEPELKILCYNGFTTDLSWIGAVVKGRSGYAVSPWWAYYVDYVYCGDPRASEIPSKRLENSVIYYTDAMIRQMRDSLLPFEFIDDSGVMCANTGTIYYLGKALLRDGLIMSLSRGARKLQFYGDLGLLDGDDRAFMKGAEKVFDRISKERFQTRFILSDPASGEPYGYETSDGTEGIITVVNPSASSEIVNIALDEWADGKSVKIRRWYSDKQIRAAGYKDTVKVFQTKVGPQSVTSFWWTLGENGGGRCLRLTLTQNDRISVTLPDNARSVSVRFQKPDGSPLRTAAGVPEEISLEYDGDLLKPLPDRRLWSGTSWVMLKRTEKKGGAVCTFENKSDRTVVILWEETADRNFSGGRI